MAEVNAVLRKFHFLFFLLGSLWKILTGKKTGDGISFGGIMRGTKAGDKLLPYYHSHPSGSPHQNGLAWRYLGTLHHSAKGWELRKALLKGWWLLSFLTLLKFLVTIKVDVKIILLCQNWLTQHKIRHLKRLKIHRKYIISLTDVPESLAGTKRCISSAKHHGEDRGMEIFPGVKKEESLAFFLEHGLTFTSTPGHEETFDVSAEMGCFASHYLLWEKCVELDEPIMILEDDVEFCAPVLPLRFKEIIHLGKPSSQWNAGIVAALSDKHQEVYNPFDHLLGTYAYGITPMAARKLIDAAHKIVIRPVDRFISSRTCDILFYLPHPITTSVKRSSIYKVPC